jgi:hypothetical protein
VTAPRYIPDPDAAAKAAAFPGFVDASCIVIPNPAWVPTMAEVEDLEARLATAEAELARVREALVAAELEVVVVRRERDHWRLQARRGPDAEAADERARHAKAERTGGR